MVHQRHERTDRRTYGRTTYCSNTARCAVKNEMNIRAFRHVVHGTQSRRRRWRRSACLTTWCSPVPIWCRQSVAASHLHVDHTHARCVPAWRHAIRCRTNILTCAWKLASNSAGFSNLRSVLFCCFQRPPQKGRLHVLHFCLLVLKFINGSTFAERQVWQNLGLFYNRSVIHTLSESALNFWCFMISQVLMWISRSFLWSFKLTMKKTAG